MNNSSYWDIIKNGVIKENPIFVLLLGMCPTLGTTSSALNGASMGLATTFVLICTNMAMSGMKKLIPDTVRIPVYVIIMASCVTPLQMCIEAYFPSLNKSLGLFIPLIVVNCIVLGRGEAFASKNKVLPSFFDGLGVGLGFTLALTLLGSIRELLGTGKIFDFSLFPEEYGALGFVLAPGAFIALGFMIAIINKIGRSNSKTS